VVNPFDQIGYMPRGEGGAAKGEEKGS